MKLFIKEYLSMLRESKDLDYIFPELLLSMGHNVFSKAQIGVRQFGVDIASTGKDEDGLEKLFLFILKRGDLDRGDWDGASSQSIRPSLNEILDVYIPHHIPSHLKELPIKIVLVTSGDMRQNVQQNWSGYTKGDKGGNVEYDFYGGDKLAILMEQYLFNEYIIPVKHKNKIRKTLALIGDPDYNLEDYFEFLDAELKNVSKNEKPKDVIKKLRLIYLIINILHKWSEDKDNLKHAILASERTALNVWGYIVKNDFFEKNEVMNLFENIYLKKIKIQKDYFIKVVPVLRARNGLYGGIKDFMQTSCILFENIGIFALWGYEALHFAIVQDNAVLLNNAKEVCHLIMEIIENNKGLYCPVLDEHIIDISLVILLLSRFNEIRFLDHWIARILESINFSYHVYGKYFPVASSDFNDLLKIHIHGDTNKEEFISTSNMIPILACWCVKLGLIQNYKDISFLANKIYSKSNLQIWYPDDEAEKFLYTTNAGYRCGVSEASIQIPSDPKSFVKALYLSQGRKAFIDIKELQCFKSGFFPLILLSNRHFRTPFFPYFFKDDNSPLDE